MLFIGADLGTSGLKMILMNENGDIVNSSTKNYPLYSPKPTHSEQNPKDWLNAFIDSTKELIKGFDKNDIKAIGVAGQMHGLVVLDKNDNILRPAILWNDGRTVKETDYLNEQIGTKNLVKYTANMAFAGFTAPKILWVKENEKEIFSKIDKIMLPKDYINYVLTKNFASDMSDASGMLLVDVKNRAYSDEMVRICGISQDMLPKLYESYDVIGTLTKEMAEILGLNKDVKVVAGAGDNAAAAIGTKCVNNGSCNISIGTSGTVFVATDEFYELKNNSVHNFAHSNGKYHYMGCMLSAASANDWWMGILDTKDFAKEQEDKTFMGKNNILYLPYLMGERSPHNDPLTRASFIGINNKTSRRDMTYSVLEGVAFGLKDSLEIIKETGINPKISTLVGGGAKSTLWQNIVANILDIEIATLNVEEGPALGAAIFASVGFGAYNDVSTACEKIVKLKNIIKPDKDIVKSYKKLYNIYKDAYKATKEINHRLANI